MKLRRFNTSIVSARTALVLVVAVAAALLSGCHTAFDPSPLDWRGADEQGSLHQRLAAVSAERGDDDGDAVHDRPLPADPTLDDYLAYAALHNPALRAAFDRWRAATARIGQVTSLPDPMFTYRYFIENVETRVGPQRHRFGFQQMFPWFGKLAKAGDVATEAAQAAYARYEGQKLALFNDVQQRYFDYYYLERAIAVVRENRDLVKYLESVARVRFKAAPGGHPDIIRAQVELGKLDDHLRELEDLRHPTVARLNAALNRPPDAPAPPPKSIGADTPKLDEKAIRRLMQQQNPQLRALQHEIAKQRHAIGLAKKNYYPDITLGVDYIETGGAVAPVSGSGKDAVAAGFSINVPIYRGRYDAAVSEAIANFGAATKQRVDRLNNLEAELSLALYRFRDAERKIDLFRDTLTPKAKQSLKATEASFRTGGSSFTDLIDAQRVLLEFSLGLERAITDRAKQLSHVETLAGQRLPRAQPKPPDDKPDDQSQDKPGAPKKPDTNNDANP